MQATIFDRFRQVRSDDATEKGGSGLGLAICQALVVLHAGTISVASQEGRGSTFTVSLPKLGQEPSEEVSEPSQMAEPPALAS
jgi:signal transduction histidine kinase